MGYLIVPLVILLIKAPLTPDSALADFSRMSKAAGHMVSLVGKDGTAREGRVTLVTADAVTMEFAAGPQVFAKADISSAERLRDGTLDGFIKGAVFGAVMGLIVLESYGGDQGGDVWLRVIGTYGAIGWALDAANTNRQPIYRAALPPPVKSGLMPAAAGLKFKLRF